MWWGPGTALSFVYQLCYDVTDVTITVHQHLRTSHRVQAQQSQLITLADAHTQWPSCIRFQPISALRLPIPAYLSCPIDSLATATGLPPSRSLELDNISMRNGQAGAEGISHIQEIQSNKWVAEQCKNFITQYAI